MQASEKLIKAVIATAQLMGTDLNADAARMFCEDLATYDEPLVLDALSRCRREVKSKLTLADVISRIDDGRPGPNEAWSLLPRGPFAEGMTIVWTEEMAKASAAANRIYDDEVAARMAFLETYQREVTKARNEGRRVKWIVSLGHEECMRETPLQRAIEEGKISASYAASLLPDGTFEKSPTLPRIGGDWHIAKLIQGEKKKETA
jgi:hypothetical protein